jgi:hypothetical protein
MHNKLLKAVTMQGKYKGKIRGINYRNKKMHIPGKGRNFKYNNNRNKYYYLINK